MKVHEKIRLIRESKHWSQEDMAEKLKMSVNGYAKIERGETKAYNPHLERIAEVLGMELMELMPVSDRHICLISGDNAHNGHNIIGSSMELAFEIQKLQLTNTHKDETIEHLKQDIARLTEMLELYKHEIGKQNTQKIERNC
ncbi:MAG: helix-turn-helix transcriptional regulator [Methylococcales bacterium]